MRYVSNNTHIYGFWIEESVEVGCVRPDRIINGIPCYIIGGYQNCKSGQPDDADNKNTVQTLASSFVIADRARPYNIPVMKIAINPIFCIRGMCNLLSIAMGRARMAISVAVFTAPFVK